MDVLKRIDEIMRKQHLNDYQLSKLSGLSTSTISNMRKRNTKNMQANYHEKIDRQKEKLEQRIIAASQMDTKNHFESVTAEENGIAE